MLRLNIGCGPVQPPNWVNIDNSNRARLASRVPWLDAFLTRLGVLPPTEFNGRTRTDDVRRHLPWPSSSVTAIYCGEMLEHFTAVDGLRFLGECFRVLVPGGVLRLRVPDNYNFWKQYITEYDAVRALPRAQWTDRHSRWVEMFFQDICVSRPFARIDGTLPQVDVRRGLTDTRVRAHRLRRGREAVASRQPDCRCCRGRNPR